MKIAIVVGHNSRRMGAYSPHLKGSEFPFNSEASELIEPGPHTVKTFFRDPSVRGYYSEILDCYGRCDDWGAEATVELHFNSATPTAHGTETLSSGSTGSMELARVFQATMIEGLGLRDRGIKVRRSGRGSLSLLAGQAPAILTEPFFGSNADDCKGMTPAKLAKVYSAAIAKL